MSKFRRRLMMQISSTPTPPKPEIPDGYSVLEKLNKKDKFVFTDYKPNNNTKIEVKLAIWNMGSSTSIIGSWVDGYNKNYGFWILYNGGVKRMDVYMNDGPGGIRLADMAEPVYNVPFTIVKDGVYNYIDGVKSQYENTPLTESQLSNVQNIILFRNTTKYWTWTGEYDVYYVKIWDNGVLVKEYIPIKNDATGEEFMYDKVNKEIQVWA